ncbi:MAG: hypothetical protein ABIP54_02605 [Candidatus Andersenbacteria bacterium]
MVQKTLQYIKNMFESPRLEREAFDAYFYRLPENVNVSWVRDENYIVGSITDNGHEYMTQAQSADELIDMVNDAVYTFHEIPEQYREAIAQYRAYNPSDAQKKLLEDAHVKSSVIAFKKNKNALRTA